MLIDAGISCRETELRMSKLQLSLSRVKALFISHEHTDHTRGAEKLSRKYRIPVYMKSGAYKYSDIHIRSEWVHTFNIHEKIRVGSLQVTPFNKRHDAADPVSFVVEHQGIKAGIITDIGRACKTVIHYFKQCHACFLESNYDEKMLREGGYPLQLKKRISGSDGHLSNTQALELFMNHKPRYMSHLLLSHLSENNNRPDIVEQLFAKYAGAVKIIIAPRHEETAVYKVISDAMREIIPLPVQKEVVQLNLF